MSCDLTLKIQKGSTWARVVLWGVSPYIYKLITGVPQLAPLRLTVVGHGLTDDWRVAITDVRGMVELNSEANVPFISEYHQARVIDADTIEINDIDALSFHDYVSGGAIRFLTPVDLTGYTARMDIREKTGGTLILSMTTTDGDIVISVLENKIFITITAADTGAVTQRRGVFSVEVEAAGGGVTQLMSGNVEFIEEVTTTETP